MQSYIVQEIELLPQEFTLDQYFYQCCFCGNIVEPPKYELSENRYCNFCLRRYGNVDFVENVLLLTFKSVFGFYYQNFYVNETKRTMWISDLIKIIDKHKNVGLENPAFDYDDDSMLWHLNFKKIGDGQYTLPIIEVFETLNDIISSLQISNFIPGLDVAKFSDKYTKEIRDFYTSRESKIVNPNLRHCGLDLDNDHNIHNFRMEKIQ